MRFLTLPLFSIILLTGLAWGQPIPNPILEVKEIPNGLKVMRGGVFSPDSGLQVKVDRSVIASKLKLGSGSMSPAELEKAVTGLTQLLKTAERGLRLLQSYQAPASTVELRKTLDEVIEDVDRYPEFKPEINARIMQAPPNRPLEALAAAFQGAAEAAQRKIAEIFATAAPIRVQLILSRDPDQSRTPEAAFGVLPSQGAQDALKKLMGELADGVDGISFQSAKKAIAKKVMDSINEKVAELKLKADNLLTTYRDRAASLEAELSGDPQAKWLAIKGKINSLETNYKQFVSGLDALRTMASEIPADGITQVEISSFAAKLSELQDILNDAKTTYGGIRTDIDSLLATLAATPKSKLEAIRQLFDDAKASAEEFVKSALGDAVGIIKAAAEMFNFIDKLEKIDETYKDITGDTAEFINEGGVLDGMSTALRSYDEIKIVVKAKKGDADYEQIGQSYPIYAWRNGRLDSIAAVGFYTRDDTTKWAGAPILGQAIKFGNRNWSFQKNRNFFPGLGYSLMAVDQDGNGQVEAGVGLMLTFLDDRLVGGYGLNTTRGGGYWYLGYRLRL